MDLLVFPQAQVTAVAGTYDVVSACLGDRGFLHGAVEGREGDTDQEPDEDDCDIELEKCKTALFLFHVSVLATEACSFCPNMQIQPVTSR